MRTAAVTGRRSRAGPPHRCNTAATAPHDWPVGVGPHEYRNVAAHPPGLRGTVRSGHGVRRSPAGAHTAPYAADRAGRGHPRVSRGGVPRRALLAGTSAGYLSVIAAWASPDVVFEFLINSYGAIALFVYLAIAVAQVRMRRKLERTAPERLTLKIWLFPWLSWVTIALMGTVTGAMAFLPGSRPQFWLGLLTVAVVLTAYEIRRRGAPLDAG
ncbi:hypothetical protein ACH4GP_04910 [Streptomyces celluloflavus]|uniref:Amino acid permease/ SLC12A domain-containing protein n=1 Tax=Streptomyces celluloflavus TaxID=58344 RepID=A0ABW7R6R7_9ACTN